MTDPKCNKCKTVFKEGGLIILSLRQGIGRKITIMPAEDCTGFELLKHDTGKVNHFCGMACWLRFAHEVYEDILKPTTEQGGE